MSARLLNVLLAVLAVAIVAGTVWFVGETQRRTVVESFNQTQAAQGMLTSMLEQETGLRGYFLNRRDEFLDSYRTGESLYRQAVIDLRRSADGGDRRLHALIDRSDEAARDWQLNAEDAIATARASGTRPTVAQGLERKAMMDTFRAADAAVIDELTRSRERSLANATRLSALVVILLSAVFAAAGWLTFGRRSVARGRRERREARHRDRQSSFARTLQFADSEGDAHALVKRHLERSVPDAAIVVLQRNNSADRLEALTPIEPGTAFAEHLVDAGPRDCLAVRMGQTYEGGTSDDLLSCSLCGKAAAELTTCTPLLVQGEVIGSVLVAHQAPLDEDERIHVDETVTQAAPVIANMRNLAIAEERASTDPLTGLANRRSITDTLRRMLAQADRTGQSMAVLALDLDHFKRINDRLGHDKGDDVLAAAAQAFQSTLRASDFVGRQGGEEFIALLPDTGLAGALSAAENVRAAIHRLEVPGIDLPVSASLGVAVFPEDGLEPEGLLRAADRALYAAKAGGRNRVASAAAPAAEAAQTPA